MLFKNDQKLSMQYRNFFNYDKSKILNPVQKKKKN